ncbi:MAG: ABC transporter substrate-binding protein [Acidocella sp.]|nr:ABC transporter substrate-binding protein [Acidocella sp.]
MSLSRRLTLGLAGAALFAPRGRAAPARNTPTPVFGAALPLSGSAAMAGSEALRGILLAADAVNTAGGIAGKPVALVTADMPDQPHAPLAVNGLISGSHATWILGSGASALSYPATAAAELAQVPFLELTAPADGITARGFKFLLRTGATTSMTASLAAATIQARYAGKTLGLLFNTGATAGAIAAALIAAKLPVALAIGYPEDAADLHDQAGRLMRAKVDVLLHAAGLDDALAFNLAAAALGWSPSVLIGCGEGYQFRETAAALGGGLSGALIIGAPFYPASAADVAAAYMARFGVAPRSADSLSAYVGAKLTFDTLNGAGGDPAKLLAALRKVNLPKGALANGFGVSFDHSGQNTASFVTLQQWRNGGLVPVAG